MDLEINRIENEENTQDATERSDSPILNSSKLTRKVLMKKLKRKKSKTRVKLTDRFEMSDPNNTSGENSTCDLTSFDLNDDDVFNSTGVRKLIDNIEENEKVVKNALSVSETDDVFKVPALPSIDAKFENSPGFQTARGKPIFVSEENVQNHSKLFSDILNTDQRNLRERKFSFLSKSVVDKDVNHHEKENEENIMADDLLIHNNELIESNKLEKALAISTVPLGATISDKFNNNLKPQHNVEAMDDFVEKFKGFENDEIQKSRIQSNIFKTNFGIFERQTSDSTVENRCVAVKASNEDNKNQLNDEKPELQLEQTCVEHRESESENKFIITFKESSQNLLDGAASANNQNLDYRDGGGLKRNQELDEAPCAKRKKPDAADENCGFRSASGKEIIISDNALKKSEKLYQDVSENECITNVPMGNIGFKTATGSHIKISDDALKRGQKLLDIPLDEETLPLKNASGNLTLNCGFASASGKKITISENALKKSEKFYNDVSGSDFVTSVPTESENVGFKTASGSKLKLSEASLKRASNLLADITEEESLTTLITPKNDLNPMKKSFTRLNVSMSETQISKMIEEPKRTKSNNSFDENVSIKKRRLGVNRCKQIAVSKDHLDRAKLMFVNNNPPVQPPIKPATVTSEFCNSTPMRPHTLTSAASTPVKVGPFGDGNGLLESTITPIKSFASQRENNSVVIHGNTFAIRVQTVGDLEQWIGDFEAERENLEMRLVRNSERQEALKYQLALRRQDNADHRGKRKGVLSIAKSQPTRIKLRHISFDAHSAKPCFNSPKSSALLHFDCKNETGVIFTSDGAIVVPNTDDFVGLSEIKAAFAVMPGVESNLMPKNWIENHFKLIVWKLASYEAKLADLKGCLSIENVIRQLKYRYDKEIDNAERPTLRKITETDDVPQKRMVLCISDIFKVASGKFELELTDGWYCLRTLIDDPLCKQIARGKVSIGTKLLICGAELTNCEGCHPLEITNLARLKINSNSTRRTVWHAKLGYQPSPEPFPIKLSSVLTDGGTIAAVKIAIARVYPVRYMERQGSMTIWRNKKAETKRAQEWDNQEVKRIEEIQESVLRRYELSQTKSSKCSRSALTKAEISRISCPQTLYEIYESASDSEWLQEMLTPAQWETIVDYQRNVSAKRNAEMQAEINSRIRDGKLQACKRDVASVLKLVVLDCMEDSDKHHIFQIWNPTENHLQILKEGSVFTVYNVIPKKNGELSSISRTKFRTELQALKTFPKYKRRVVSIDSLWEMTAKPIFKEFDTVGIVVQFDINSFNQLLWLADVTGRLLFLKVYDGPQTCAIFDNLKRGQIIAASNLNWLMPSNKDFTQAVVTQFSLISHYPHAVHLSEALEELNAKLPENLDQFLDECDLKISLFIDKLEVVGNNSSKNLINSSSSVLDESQDESTLTYSGITTTDMALSLMDIDKFL